MGLNQNFFLYINSLAASNSALNAIMIFIAKYTPYIFIGLLFCLWFSSKKNEALYSGYAATLGVATNYLIGLFYFHPRPFMENIGILLLEHKAENSFPSDHTTFVLSIALMLILKKSTRTIGIFAMIFAILCGISRVYCGVHYPFDILGSFVVSVLSIMIITISMNKLKKLNKIVIKIWDTTIGFVTYKLGTE